MNTYIQFDPANPPPPLLTSEPDSFAHKTIAIRKPAIAQTVLADHAGQYPPKIVEVLQNLRDELAQGRPVRPLETVAPDGESWRETWLPYQHRTWFDIPWYFAEVFFYRRLLEAAGYFGGGPWAGVDPFLPRKQAELTHAAPWQVLRLAMEYASTGAGENFCALFRHCVWGNRVDLSHPKIVEEMRQQAGQKTSGDLLADDTEAVLAHLRKVAPGAPKIDFICDNTGTELLLDLALADFLLRFDWAGQVTLHIKAQPTFVSDAIPADIEITLAALKARGENNFTALAARLQGYQGQQRLVVRPDIFWNSSHFFWELPADLYTELAQARLVILKGDANYRRLLGDSRCWPATISFTEAAPYFPAPFVTLRAMKSEVIIGLQPGQTEALNQADPAWRVNGRRAVIQGRL